MTYKALMLDVDGTLIPYDYKAFPSDITAEAIKRAKEHVLVSVVTGRSFGFAEPILNKLGLREGFAVVNNGAQVIDIATKNILYDQPLNPSDTEEIVRYLRSKAIPFYLKEDTFSNIIPGRFFPEDKACTKAYMIFTEEVFSEEEIDTILKELSHLSETTLNRGHHKVPNKFSFHVCHVKATKLHGIEYILNETGITRNETIAVGDSYNDFPLLMAAGLKVAMGNAVPELKAIADVIAPNVRDDGVAAIINKYILNAGNEPKN